MMYNNRSVLAVFFALVSVSCVKEEYNIDKISSSVDVTSSIALPIASGSVTLEQVLPENKDTTKYVYVDKDNLLHLVYKQTLDSISFGKYGNIIKDMQSSTTIPVPLPANTPIKITAPNLNIDVNLDRNDQSISSALLQGGHLTISSSANFSGSLTYTVQSENIIPPKETMLDRSFSNSLDIDLKGCTIKPNTNGQICFSISCTGTKQSAASINDKVTLSFGLNSIRISELVGNLGQISIPLLNNSFPLDFSKMVDGTGDSNFDFDIKNPMIELIFRNQAGLPFAFIHSGVTATKNAQPYSITGLPSPIKIYAPAENVEKEKISNATIGSNSNLVSVLAKFPQSLNFNGNLVANPSSISPSVANHIRVTDKLYIAAHADLPLDVMLSNIVLKDTSSYDFSSIVKDSKSIDKMKLQFQFKNGFPFNLDVSAYIVDATGKKLDDVFLEPFKLKAANTFNGLVTTATESKIDVTYDQTRIQKLKSGDRIIFVSKANTAGSDTRQTVKLLAKYKMDIKVVGFIQANLKNL